MGNTYDSVVITGGKGMLAHAVRTLLERRGVAPVGVDIDTHDLTKPADAARLFDEHKPTLVLNCAAFTNVDKCETEPALADAVNGTAVGTLAALAKDHGTRLIHISTDFVFDGTKQTPYLPADQPSPLSAYGRSKLLGENKLRQIAPAGWVIVRTAWLYGPHGNSFPKAIVSRARQGGGLKVVSDQVGCPTYTFDLAEALLGLVDAKASGIFHVVNGGTPTTWHGFAVAAVRAFGLDEPVEPITSADWAKTKPGAAHRPAYSVLDTSAYTQVTGKQMRPWEQALADFRAVADF